MKNQLSVGTRRLGDGEPIFIVAEIGINHNGNIRIARDLIEAAAGARCDAVKFQKRTPDRSVPAHMRESLRETPWGMLPLIEYRKRMEFTYEQYGSLIKLCECLNLQWFFSSWDVEALDLAERFGPPCHKIPSACLEDDALLRSARGKLRPVILSTGMSDIKRVDRAVEIIGTENLLVLQCTSIYPCPPARLNLRVLHTFRQKYQTLVGYSGHEAGFHGTLAAVALGACYVERHITLNKRMLGTDHASSLLPVEFETLVREIRSLEASLGDGEKAIYAEEAASTRRLRSNNTIIYCGTCNRVLAIADDEFSGTPCDCRRGDRSLRHHAKAVSVAGKLWVLIEALLLRWEDHISPLKWFGEWGGRSRGRAGYWVFFRAVLLLFALWLARFFGDPRLRLSSLPAILSGVTAFVIAAGCLADILISNTSIVFVSHAPKNRLRAAVFTIAAFFELGLAFAVFYMMGAGLISIPHDSPGSIPLLTPTGALYFSLVTLATVGYGDFRPEADSVFMKGLVGLEIMCGFYFVVLLVATLVAQWGNSAVEKKRAISLESFGSAGGSSDHE